MDAKPSGEVCQSCGRAYDTVYHVPDSVWARLLPNKAPAGLLCIPCAIRIAGEKGIDLWWDAAENDFPTAALESQVAEALGREQLANIRVEAMMDGMRKTDARLMDARRMLSDDYNIMVAIHTKRRDAERQLSEMQNTAKENGWMKRILLAMSPAYWMGWVEGPHYATGDFDELAFFRALRNINAAGG